MTDVMQAHPVVSHGDWITARQALLQKEKAFTRLRDELSQARRDLPSETVEKAYVFDGPDGPETLEQLFAGKSQLIVYYFMFAPDWEAGCPSCSFWADNSNGIDVHLRQRDISFLAVSRAPLTKLQAYKRRMGWSFKWVSSYGTSFNYDYYASFTEAEIANGDGFWNYHHQPPGDTDHVGISVFYKDADGQLFHTYSCYARGIDLMNGAYNYVDLTPKGRDEAGQGPGPQAWVRRHDEYDAA